MSSTTTDMPPPYRSITIGYIEYIEGQYKGLEGAYLKLEAKNKELNARIEQYKSWLTESCSCKGE